jgi:hypothetical protein
VAFVKKIVSSIFDNYTFNFGSFSIEYLKRKVNILISDFFGKIIANYIQFSAAVQIKNMP